MKRTKRAAAVLALLALLAAGCGDSDTTATRDPKPADSTVAGGEPTQQTADSTPATRAESPWPWHAPGSAHGEPADAVAEFVEYFEFDPMVVLTDYQESDAHSGEIEIVPPLLGEPFVPAESPGMSPTEWANERLGEMYEGGWAGPTTAFVRLDDDHAWVVTGAVSGVVAVESPAPDAAVSSPLDILYTNNIMTNGVVIELWPVGADEPIATKTNPERGDAFSAGERLVTMEWSSNAVGPVTVIMTSARPVVGVVTFELELEPRSDPPPFTDPVGDQRRDILYQPDGRLSVYEPDECGDERRATILTSGGSGIGAAHRDDFTRLGYTVVEIAPRPQTGPSSLNKGLLGDLTFAANDLGIAVRWLRAHADELCLNPDRIAAVGHSFSAIAALSLAYTEGELDPGDTITLPGLGSTEFPDVSPSPPPAELEAYSNRIDAVVSFAGFAVADTIDPVEPPSLLIHGRNDQAAPFALAKKTCTAATAVGVRCELLPHDDGHDLPADHSATVAAIDDFLRHELEAGTPAGQGEE